MVFDEIGTLENCENLEESFGEICVHCNKCGRFDKKDEKTGKEGKRVKTMSGHNPETITKQGCIAYLNSWSENLKDRIEQGDPRKRLYEEQIIFLNKAIEELESEDK